MDRRGSFEFTIKYILKVYDYYHKTCLHNQPDDNRLIEKESEIMRIFNYQQNPIIYNKSKVKPKSNPQENNDVNDVADSNTKVDEGENEAEGEGEDDFLFEEPKVENIDEDMPYIMKVLFPHMTPQVYKEKS